MRRLSALRSLAFSFLRWCRVLHSTCQRRYATRARSFPENLDSLRLRSRGCLKHRPVGLPHNWGLSPHATPISSANFCPWGAAESVAIAAFDSFTGVAVRGYLGWRLTSIDGLHVLHETIYGAHEFYFSITLVQCPFMGPFCYYRRSLTLARLLLGASDENVYANNFDLDFAGNMSTNNNPNLVQH
jgi:hypothetical protein